MKTFIITMITVPALTLMLAIGYMFGNADYQATATVEAIKADSERAATALGEELNDLKSHSDEQSARIGKFVQNQTQALKGLMPES